MRYFLALRVVVSDVPQILMRAGLALIFNWRNTTNFIVRYKGRKESHQPKETQSFYIQWRIRTFRVRSCRPGDKVGGGGGETVSKQNFFSALRTSVWPKNKAEPWPPGPLPWIRHLRTRSSAILSLQQAVCISFDGKFYNKKHAF